MKALRIRQRVFGDDHPETAASYNNLALTLNLERRFASAAAVREGD